MLGISEAPWLCEEMKRGGDSLAGQSRDCRQEEACTVWLHLCGESEEGPCGAVSDHEMMRLDYTPRGQSQKQGPHTGGVFITTGP